MHIIQPPLFDFEAFIVLEKQERLLIVLEALSTEKLLSTLERERWTGRKGYSLRGMWAALIAGVLHQCTSIAGTVRLLEGNKDVRALCGFPARDMVPSEDALGRFLEKLVVHEELVEACFEELVERLRQLLPGFGQKMVVDSTDIKAFSNGHRSRKSDIDAKWGAKKANGHYPDRETDDHGDGGVKKGKRRDLYYWFGYKLHLLIDGFYELPVSFVITPANEADTTQMPVLLEKAYLKRWETRPEAVIADKGYDSRKNNQLIYKEYHAAPIIPIKEREGAQLPDICNAKGTPTCSCGLEMVYWGRDGNYLKYRCPHVLGRGVCSDLSPCTASPYGYVLKLPITDDVRRHPPIPRQTKKWNRLYRLRSAVERVNSRLKELLGLGKITVRGIKKVIVRSLLSLLVMVAAAVGMAQRNKFKEIRALVS
jgi:IS5 family transposase